MKTLILFLWTNGWPLEASFFFFNIFLSIFQTYKENSVMYSNEPITLLQLSLTWSNSCHLYSTLFPVSYYIIHDNIYILSTYLYTSYICYLWLYMLYLYILLIYMLYSYMLYITYIPYICEREVSFKITERYLLK